MNKNKIACVDFDGICVMQEYPKIGENVPNAVAFLKKLNNNQVKLILWTNSLRRIFAGSFRE